MQTRSVLSLYQLKTEWQIESHYLKTEEVLGEDGSDKNEKHKKKHRTSKSATLETSKLQAGTLLRLILLGWFKSFGLYLWI